MKRAFRSKFLTVVCVFLTIQCLPASSKNQIFKAYHWSPVSRDFTEETIVTKRGNDVQLRCTVSDAVTPQSLVIRRLDQDIQFLNKTYDRSTHSLRVTLTNIQCDEQGTYVCEHREQKEMLDLRIPDCGPKLCKNETNPKVVYTEINKPTTFSLCIVAKTVKEIVYINNKPLRENENDTNNTWAWKSTYKEFNNFRNYVNFTVRNVSKNDYKTYDVTLTSQTSQTKMEEKFRIELKEPVELECPTDIKLTNQHTDSVTLSWQPGDPGADSQWFYVYYTCLSCGLWKKERTGVEETSVTISNLIQNKHYIVRVEPHNSADLVNTTCQVFDFSTVVTIATTITISEPTDINSTNSSDERFIVSIIIVILSDLAILAVAMAVLRFFFKCRLKRRHSLPWNSRRTTLSQRNGRHLPGTTQEMSLMNNGNGSQAQYQNVRGEQIYQTVF